MLDREEAIRSKSPTTVKQELWGIFLAYNLVRLEMQRVADDAGVEPTRISFVAALRRFGSSVTSGSGAPLQPRARSQST